MPQMVRSMSGGQAMVTLQVLEQSQQEAELVSSTRMPVSPKLALVT